MFSKSRVFNIIEKLLNYKYLKWIHIFIWSCKLRGMAKKRVKNQIGNLILDHSNPKIVTKWPLMETCNMELKISHWMLQLCNWKLFNRSSYEEVMNPQHYKIHNLESLKKNSHFNVGPTIRSKLDYSE